MEDLICYLNLMGYTENEVSIEREKSRSKYRRYALIVDKCNKTYEYYIHDKYRRRGENEYVFSRGGMFHDMGSIREMIMNVVGFIE